MYFFCLIVEGRSRLIKHCPIYKTKTKKLTSQKASFIGRFVQLSYFVLNKLSLNKPIFSCSPTALLNKILQACYFTLLGYKSILFELTQMT